MVNEGVKHLGGFYYFSASCEKMKLLKTSAALIPSREAFVSRAVLQHPGASGTWALQTCFCLGWLGPSRVALLGREVAGVLLWELTASQPACSLQKCSPVIIQERSPWFNAPSRDGGSMEQPLALPLISHHQQVSVSQAMLCPVNPNLGACS